ncbi:MAG: SIMPL domain-containing protein [Sphingomonas sp.]|uniref:SIMPL domain-containing protein n=1 Tax=Sphingomonas sp. TaxID=28214 RepID=UPI0025E6AA26|nr:SIMPL domain-containing protein [Sphingomonas sp.]MBX3565608.1 SIMPL domain-containing protein [Sphingomonas sp.]
MIRTALAATAALFTVSALPAAAQEMRPVPADGTLLEVSAEGVSTRVPDVALIQAGVITQAPTAAVAMAQNSKRMAAVLAALRGAGIAERDLQTASISLSPQYRYENNQPPILTGYQASNQVTVRFRDVAQSGTILDTLVKQGANNISGPNLTVDKPEAALDEARTNAIAKARARATLYANAAGLKVDRILTISESGAMPAPVPVMAFRADKAMAQASTEVVAGEQQLSVTVSVRFLLK